MIHHFYFVNDSEIIKLRAQHLSNMVPASKNIITCVLGATFGETRSPVRPLERHPHCHSELRPLDVQ